MLMHIRKLCRHWYVSNRRRHLSLSLLTITCALSGCGSDAPPPLPPPDFSVSVSPASVSTQVGTTTSPVTISVNGESGFSGSVSVALQGIPQGITASPSSFSLVAGASQSVTFSVPDSATVGTSAITVLGTGGTHWHSAQLTLTADAIVRTYQIGSVLYLESGTATDTSRIGLETAWGGSIVEVSLNGTEFVNRHDTGREVQPAFYDGNAQYCSGCGPWGWNPVLAGDYHNQGTPTLTQIVTSNSLYTSAQPLQYYPDDKGGGAGQPISGDVLVEQTITAETSLPHTFKAHYKVTHLGSDLHADAPAEFPAVYTNQNYNRFISYGGTAPWTNGAITITQLPAYTFSPILYVPEHWGALVDTQNVGLTVYVPSQYPYVVGFAEPDPGPGGPTDNADNYFAPAANLTIGPSFVFQGDIYLIAGDFASARGTVYALHQSLSPPDIFMPIGATDQPSPGSSLVGITSVGGWSLDDVQVAKAEVLVDGVADGTATYGSPRPDVAAAYPHAPVNLGFSYSLDTTKYNDGFHTLNVRVTDSSGNAAVFADVLVSIVNSGASASFSKLPGKPRRAPPPRRSHLDRRYGK
jgi:hypothetical protein